MNDLAFSDVVTTADGEWIAPKRGIIIEKRTDWMTLEIWFKIQYDDGGTHVVRLRPVVTEGE